MAEAPGGRRSDVEKVAERGRPLRMRELLAAAELDPVGWRGMPRGEQEALLQPFVLEGENLRMTNAGEIYIDTGERHPAVPGNSETLEVLQKRAMTRRQFERAVRERSREAFVEGFVAATVEYAPLVVELQEMFLRDALSPDASDKDKDRALRAMKELQDRWMGRTTQTVEVSSQSKSVVQVLAQKGAFEQFEPSDEWTIEGVAMERSGELEAGEVGDDE